MLRTKLAQERSDFHRNINSGIIILRALYYQKKKFCENLPVLSEAKLVPRLIISYSRLANPRQQAQPLLRHPPRAPARGKDNRHCLPEAPQEQQKLNKSAKIRSHQRERQRSAAIRVACPSQNIQCYRLLLAIKDLI